MKQSQIVKNLLRKIIPSALLFASTCALGGTFLGESKADVQPLTNKVLAAQFLSHATFGPKVAEIEALAERMNAIGATPAMTEWIDNQMQLAPTSHEDTAVAMITAQGLDPLAPGLGSRTAYKHAAWWHNAINAPDQLRQRMAWALGQVFVVNEFDANFSIDKADTSGNPAYLGITDYYDLMVENAFGNYRELLEDVSYHPVMGIFLSHLKNPKADPAKNIYPDENYGREVLQLFSMGVYQINNNGVYKTDKNGNPIELYDNETIKAFARVFTGLGWGGASSFSCGSACRNLHDPMTMFDSAHDTDAKILLNGVVLPAGQTGAEDIAGALDNIAAHPNVAPFISRLLIQRLVTSNPSRGYIRRVAAVFNDDGNGNRGNFAALVKAILLDKEAIGSASIKTVRKPWGILVQGGGTEKTRLKEPVLRYTAFLRAFNPATDFPTGYLMMPSQADDMNQAPYQSPSVFNFYQAEYQPNGDIFNYQPSKNIPNGDIYAPEFQVLTSVTANRFANQLRNDVADAKADFSFNGLSADVLLDFSAETALAETPESLLPHLDLLFCNGAMSDASRNLIATTIAEVTTSGVDRAKGAILATLTNPECAVTE